MNQFVDSRGPGPKRGKRGIIVAVSPEGAIGLNGGLPWNHPGDQQRFKRITLDSAIIMGRLTWESMRMRALPKRRNVVVSRKGKLEGIEHYKSVTEAIDAIEASEEPPKEIWVVGGAGIYAEGLKLVDVLDITYVPDHVVNTEAVHFPYIDERIWQAGPMLPHEDEPGLTRREYTRIG